MNTIIPQPVSFVVSLMLLLLFARMLGEVFERFKQPAMIGEVLAGTILGPFILNIVQPTNEIKVIADLGVLLLVIVAGFEINPEDLRKSVKGKNLWIAILGFFIPWISGFLLGYFFNLNILLSIFIGLCISITALPVSIRILMDIGKLNTNIGSRIISAAIFNDILSLLVLGVILDVRKNWGNQHEMTISGIISFVKLILFIGFLYIAYKLFKYASEKVQIVNDKIEYLLDFLKGKESLFAIIMLFVLIFASVSELVGLHFIIGAFFGAILLNKEVVGEDNFLQVKNNTNSITMGFLAPIFFAYIGIMLTPDSINNLWLLFWVILISFISKIAGGFLGGLFSGFSRAESLTLGIGLNARGIMELVIASIALKNGFIDVSIFSILIIMGLLTTLVSPFLLKKAFARIE